MALSIQDERRHMENLLRRQAQRLADNERAATLSLSAPEILGVAAIVPAGALEEPHSVTDPAMRRSDAVEDAAMEEAMAYEIGRGWNVEDVHGEDRGYDLISRGPEEQVRYIEVKGRAGMGDVELSANEWLKAQQLGDDYWLYIVSNALTAPELQRVQNPAQRLPSDQVQPRTRYRVRRAGWSSVAEPGSSREL
jgi:hypothetical protein